MQACMSNILPQIQLAALAVPAHKCACMCQWLAASLESQETSLDSMVLLHLEHASAQGCLVLFSSAHVQLTATLLRQPGEVSKKLPQPSCSSLAAVSLCLDMCRPVKIERRCKDTDIPEVYES